jgi:hypothetical protein
MMITDAPVNTKILLISDLPGKLYSCPAFASSIFPKLFTSAPDHLPVFH